MVSRLVAVKRPNGVEAEGGIKQAKRDNPHCFSQSMGLSMDVSKNRVPSLMVWSASHWP